MDAKQVWWSSENPTNCDSCGSKIKDMFFDAKTKGGPWGCLCLSCFTLDGVGLGTGRGQRYQKQSNGRFLKVSG